jgi:hypothetical protein
MLHQLEAIANDTRLPGEIAGAYGVNAAVIAANTAQGPPKESGCALETPSI